jgi:hypothetical protein
MGGGEHGARSWFTQEREGSRRWQGAFRATKDMVCSFLSYPLRCMGFSATARPRRCSPVKHGGGVLREREGPRLNLFPPRDRHARAGVHGNAGRRVGKTTRASASVNANATGSARRRGLERHRTADTTIWES